MKKLLLLIVGIFVILFAVSCNALQEIVPLPDSTANPTPTKAISTPTPLPTLGELEPIDAAYCLESAPDAHEVEFSLLRFYPSGVVLHVTVKGQNSCEETWAHISPHLKETATDIYSHGEYEYSDMQIRFALAPPGSYEAAGTVNGRIEGDRLILQQQGTEKVYDLVYGGIS